MIGLVIIGMVDIVFTLIDMFINNGVPFLIVLKLLIYKIPAIMVLFFPMAVLFSTLITLIRMAKDSEVTVLRAGGISLMRIVFPVIVFGVLTSGLSYVTNEVIVPKANSISDQLIDKAVMKKPTPDIAQDTFFKESNGRYFYIRQVNREKNEMEDIMVYETTANFPRVILAKVALWDGVSWILKNGTIHKYTADGLLTYQGTFQSMAIHLDQDIYQYYKSQKSPMEMTSKELKDKINKLQSGGVAADSLKVAYHMKYSTPVACLVFAAVGTALILLFVRNTKDVWGVIIAVLMALISVGFYFFVMATFRSLGRGGFVPPAIGAWGPNIIYGVLAVTLLIMQNRRR
jgi:lipopolysaccharide export system permease protein